MGQFGLNGHFEPSRSFWNGPFFWDFGQMGHFGPNLIMGRLTKAWAKVLGPRSHILHQNTSNVVLLMLRYLHIFNYFWPEYKINFENWFGKLISQLMLLRDAYSRSRLIGVVQFWSCWPLPYHSNEKFLNSGLTFRKMAIIGWLLIIFQISVDFMSRIDHDDRIYVK